MAFDFGNVSYLHPFVVCCSGREGGVWSSIYPIPFSMIRLITVFARKHFERAHSLDVIEAVAV